MSQHNHQPQYVHYTGPPGTHNQPQSIAPQETTTHQHAPPLVATGDWTKSLVELAKTAELKKHALTLQLHTAHILSAHASLEQKSKAVQDIREQKNKLESERGSGSGKLPAASVFIKPIHPAPQADLLESKIDKECAEIRRRIQQITEGEYTVAKRDVDRLRQELGQPPLPSLQTMLDEKSSQFLTERRLNGNAESKRGPGDDGGQLGKKPRGRPKGSKNRIKVPSAPVRWQRALLSPQPILRKAT
ncbi:uncharacterized protein BT62DRAFT_918710 [Guyanagaster necrorhizus]|uniref:Uncharacterized protein n=1 Tax=Guyanagaster necrorhizus TaxID=856835 RepID=A0A9P7VWQ1_9AGAR|nr:uncharacterized protein BT62DRAFT_918710 [Guyanagaster necrorhizus MCA 3950]KAG7448307.1 hypothetical protein BT62DRAFT_918710 [Guyanagaster necrorhizus MCA 3950]